MRASTVLALAAVAAVSQERPPDDPVYWQVEDPDHWLGLIADHTPPASAGASESGHFCFGVLGDAHRGVSESADEGSLYWHTNLEGYRGATMHDPKTIFIAPYHAEHTSDYEKARTMAHEGLHWHFGPAPFQYKGDIVPNRWSAEELIDQIIKDCFEDEKEEEDDIGSGGGGGGGGGGQEIRIDFASITCDMVYNEGETTCLADIVFEQSEPGFVEIDYRNCPDPSHDHSSTESVWVVPDTDGIVTIAGHCFAKGSGWECKQD